MPYNNDQFLTGAPAMTDTPAALTLAAVDENKYSISPAANQYLKMGSYNGQYLWNNAWAIRSKKFIRRR